MKTYRPALDVLRELPPVFTANDIQRATGLDRSQARTYLSRWASRNLIALLGPQAGVYFNLTKDPRGHITRVEEAVHRLFPSAVVASLTVLHDEGIITQIPAHLHVAVLARRSYPELPGVKLHPRPKTWYAKMREANQILPAHPPGPLGEPGNLPRLSPEAALIDAIKYRDGWISDPTDIDPDDLDRELLQSLVSRLAVDPAFFHEMMSDTQGPGLR